MYSNSPILDRKARKAARDARNKARVVRIAASKAARKARTAAFKDIDASFLYRYNAYHYTKAVLDAFNAANNVYYAACSALLDACVAFNALAAYGAARDALAARVAANAASAVYDAACVDLEVSRDAFSDLIYAASAINSAVADASDTESDFESDEGYTSDI
jgi:hypothetical protein